MAVNNLNTPGVGIQPSIVDAKGDLLVGTAADAISRLGVTGTTGAVLTADAGETTGLKWAAAGSVGGLVHINETSFSAVASQALPNNTFTATYENYRILVEISTGNCENMRLRKTGINATTNYNSQRQIAADAIRFDGRLTAQTSWEFNSPYFAVIDLCKPQVLGITTANTIAMKTPTAPTSIIYGYAHTTSDSYDSIDFFPNSGTITGKISVFGYRLQESKL